LFFQQHFRLLNFTKVTSDLRAGVKIWLFRAHEMHPAIIIGTVRLLWTWLWGRLPRSTECISSRL